MIRRRRRRIIKKPKPKKTPKKRVRYAGDNASYGGYSKLVDHPLPHVDHEHDLMEHIATEFSTSTGKKFHRFTYK